MRPDPSSEVDVLLVGGGVASVRCARTLRRLGFEGSIMLVGDEPVAPYNRPPLSKELLREELSDDLVAAEPPAWYARRGIELRTGRRVVELHPGSATATLDDGALIRFGRCLLATGAEPRRLPAPGGDRALLLRTLADARSLRMAAVAASSGAPVVVVGGGFIGLEVASSLAALGLRPTVVELGAELWSGSLGTELSGWAVDRLHECGVTVRLGEAIDRLESGAGWIDGERLEAAFAVAGIGVRPRDELATKAGLAVADGILTDHDLRTSHEAVWAAGDVARISGRRIEHWHAAREGGERAARSMLGQAIGPAPVPWVFTEVAGHSMDVVGPLGEWEEERWIQRGSVLAFLAGDRVVQLALIGGALPVERARQLVGDRASVDALGAALAG